MSHPFEVIEQYIREIAYQLWNSAGRPDGLSERFWAMAHDICSEAELFLFA